jgi:hypothetical protein
MEPCFKWSVNQTKRTSVYIYIKSPYCSLFKCFENIAFVAVRKKMNNKKVDAILEIRFKKSFK